MDQSFEAIEVAETGPDFTLGALDGFRRSHIFADIEFVTCDMQKIPAHSAVLAPASEFLANIFMGHPTLGITVDKVSVMVPDASADDINCFLDLIYNGEMETDETRKATIESLMILFSVTKDIWEPGHARSDDGEAEDEDDDDDTHLSLLEPKTEIEIDDSWSMNTEEKPNTSKFSPAAQPIRFSSSNVHVQIEAKPRTKRKLPEQVSVLASKQPILPKDIAMKLAMQHPQLSIEPSSKVSLDQRTREALEQSDWDRAAGRKCERCKCPNCVEPGLSMAKGEKQLHICHYPDCRKAYKKTSHLRAHLRGHIGDQPFVCSWENCGKKFTRSDELHRHFRIHTGEKNHKCPHCDKGFSRSDHLKKHIVSHTKNNLY